jgi:enamine deaminase RidA (YjgF/YER057c/UK114 family)
MPGSPSEKPSSPGPGGESSEPAAGTRRHQGKFDPTTPVRIPAGAPWAPEVGYCRAVQAGDRIHVSGTAPVEPDGSTHAPGDGYRQMKRCLEIVERALAELGVGLDRVVRTRIYVTDISRWEEIGRAHGEAFAAHPPATTMVEVSALIAPEMLVEVEAEAWLPPGS